MRYRRTCEGVSWWKLAAVGEADTNHGEGLPGQVGHLPCRGQGVGERFLAQHVLAGLDEPPDHLEVQAVRDDDADHLDVGVVGDGPPVRVAALIAVAAAARPASAFMSPVET